MFPILQLGPLTLPVPRLVLVLGLALGYGVTERAAPRVGLPRHVAGDGLFWSLIAGLAGARVMYVLRFPQAFQASPWSVLSPNPGLLDPVGGMVAAGLLLAWWGYRHRIPLARLADAMVPFLAIMQAAVALAHAARGTFYGMPTDLPWGVTFLGIKRHPTALYWFALALLVAWDAERRLRRPSHPPGAVFWPFFTLSVLAYIFVEGLRGDAAVLANGLRIGHLVGLPLLALGFWQWAKRREAGMLDR